MTVEKATSGKIACKICGAYVHSIQMHIKSDHHDWNMELYKTTYPGEPILSELALQKIEEASKKAAVEEKAPINTDGKRALHELFGLGKVKAAMNARGDSINVTSFIGTDISHPELLQDVDKNYVFEIENLKNAMMAIELKIPMYIWGHAGTGKTTLLEQIAARTGRMLLRVQHTINTEESHIVGQWTARAGETVFELGPLAMAMKYGWSYLADEYDFALPSVLSVYQPVLEGKPLVIKEADAANRIIRPHPNFRFLATGNTNGAGDDTGLYQGTQVQNAANYDRFHMVLEIKYMKAALETQVLMNQAGISKVDAEKMVDFANRVRESYEGSKISAPISPRTLIASAQIGLGKGSYRQGIALAFANKLSRIDKEVVDGLSQRLFGD